MRRVGRSFPRLHRRPCGRGEQCSFAGSGLHIGCHRWSSWAFSLESSTLALGFLAVEDPNSNTEKVASAEDRKGYQKNANKRKGRLFRTHGFWRGLARRKNFGGSDRVFNQNIQHIEWIVPRRLRNGVFGERAHNGAPDSVAPQSRMTNQWPGTLDSTALSGRCDLNSPSGRCHARDRRVASGRSPSSTVGRRCRHA